MAEVWASRGEAGVLIPYGDDSINYVAGLKFGEVVKISVTKPRNGKHHRLGMLILRGVFNNQDRYSNFEKFLDEVKILTGHVETRITSGGFVYCLPKSIAFENMDELEFREWKNSALQAVIDHFIPGMSRGDQERMMNHILAVG